MRTVVSFPVVAFLIVASLASAQVPGWRRSLMGVPAHPSPSTSLEDIQTFERNARMGVPYFAALTPGDYEANRAFVRQMAAYLAAVDLASRNPQVRAALPGAYAALAAWRYIYPGALPPPGELPSPAPGRPPDPPFELRAPAIDDPAGAELRDRYNSTAIRAAKAWQNAEIIRAGLESRGMTLNEQTANSVARLQLDFELAAAALRARDWNEAQEYLQRAEGETEKIGRSVGH